MSEQEIWRDVVGYEGLYKVSNRGNIYSVERKDSRGIRCGGQTLKPIYNKYGYLRVNLCKDGKAKAKYIHRIVAQAFVPNQNNYLEINHKDENKTNNIVENLEWCTSKYNANYGTRTERMSDTNSITVKGVHTETGEEIYLKSMLEGTLYGFDPTSISRVCSGRYQTHKGYSFRKIEEGEVVTFTSTVESGNKVYASQKLPKKVKAVNVESGEVLTFSSVKEAINKGYSRGIYEACRGVYNTGDGHLYRGHRWSYV